jgi:hypothetical protein
MTLIRFDLLDNYQPIHFFDDPIQPVFDTPPAREKTPDCPDGFIWNEKTYHVTEMLSSWSDFARRGKMARNIIMKGQGERKRDLLLEKE